jgi:hypothetical protein
MFSAQYAFLCSLNLKTLKSANELFLSLTAREGHRLMVFGSMALRGIFGSKAVKMAGEWTKLPNEELHDLYSSPHIIRIIKSGRMTLSWHVEKMLENTNKKVCKAIPVTGHGGL